MSTSQVADLAEASAGELVAALAANKVSALELCDQAIARIEQRDPALNAVVVRDFERAREQARTADRALARGERRALLGLPMTVKESFAVAGLPTSWGLPQFRDHCSEGDAVVVARLKAAGAVILGKTNVAPALGDWASDNPVYGRTLHPRDARRTPGGSSGGAAAALASGIVALELGSDIAGSIRVPAHFCGIVGHNPSYGLVPSRGHDFPQTDGEIAPLGVVGPMARTVSDLSLALCVIAGPDDDAATAYRLALPSARGEQLAGLRILVLDEHPSARTDGEVKSAVHRVARELERAGTRVAHQSEQLPDLAQAQRVYRKLLLTVVLRGQTSPARTPLSAYDWLELIDARARLRRQWASLFRDFDAVVAPPFGSAAPPHIAAESERMLRIDGEDTPYFAQSAWPGVATLPGLPATVVPVSETGDGLPIGVQVIGPYLEDHTPLSIARELSRILS